MSTISDISQALGDYMLKGWVLTDQSCPTPGCSVPLVRSPKGTTPVTTLCVKCRGGSSAATVNPVAPLSDASTDSRHSRSSTPPTEFSDIPGSPTFIPLEESEESRRRRAQSDQASSEIGKKLLQGWAMLGEECPNVSCYGVPLVRPPKAGGEKDPRMECVICGNIYISEVDWAGRTTLVPYQSGSKQRKKDQGQNALSGVTPAPGSMTTVAEPQRSVHPTAPCSPSSLPSLESSNVALNEASQALQSSLRALTSRLATLASSSIVDAQSIGTTADAIAKVTTAMVQVQHLQATDKQ
ncbi:hypothetical protein CVT26_001557 [Gymnopilus dilepis]|uniref:Uncharacterized protein n=1 Tax=Gymnopilus dilepis TaxID=231916 RepID=A0A409VTF2_9AGAR|nr:hypothetical protein CVT26_001557 [Gymnopilus dilepis]